VKWFGRVKWFGASWEGAPLCEPGAHGATPVGQCCGRCRRPIVEGDQGITMPLVTLEGVSTIAFHLECRREMVAAHTFSCPLCRGREIDNHMASCPYRIRGLECNCFPAWSPSVN
jgi:hypothetical protein